LSIKSLFPYFVFIDATVQRNKKSNNLGYPAQMTNYPYGVFANRVLNHCSATWPNRGFSFFKRIVTCYHNRLSTMKFLPFFWIFLSTMHWLVMHKFTLLRRSGWEGKNVELHPSVA